MSLFLSLRECLFPLYVLVSSLIIVVLTSSTHKRFKTVSNKSLLGLETSGILLYRHDGDDGSRLEYRDAITDILHHESIFSLSSRSFVIEQGYSDVVVVADSQNGIVSRMNRSPPDFVRRQSPRVIAIDEKNGVLMWLEGQLNNMKFAISVFNQTTNEYGIIKNAPLNVDECGNAKVAAAARFENVNIIREVMERDRSMVHWRIYCLPCSIVMHAIVVYLWDSGLRLQWSEPYCFMRLFSQLFQ